MIKRAVLLSLWVVIPSAILALAYALGAGFLAICLYAFLPVLVAASLMPWAWLKPIEVEREVNVEVVNVGESVRVVVKIKNRAPWPILWLYAEETLPEFVGRSGTFRRLMFLPPRSSFHMLYTLTPSKRGCVQLGPLVLETGDVFGLFKRCRVDQRRDFITVLPNYRVIEEFQAGQRRNFADIPTKRSLFEDPTRIRGIREYRRGDAFKNIHWKSSARTGELRTKIYDPVMESGATLVLDFHEDSWAHENYSYNKSRHMPPTEVAIEAACSIARYLTDGGWKVGLFSNGRDPLGLPGITVGEAKATNSLRVAIDAANEAKEDNRLAPIAIRARRSPSQFRVIQENLGRIELTDGLQIERLIFDELPYIERTQALVFLIGDISDPLIGALARIREQGYRVMVFVVCNDEGHDLAFEKLMPRGIDVFRMDLEWRLKEIATGRQTF